MEQWQPSGAALDLAEKIVRLEYPSYEKAADGFRRGAESLKQQIAMLIQGKINRGEMTIFSISPKKEDHGQSMVDLT